MCNSRETFGQLQDPKPQAPPFFEENSKITPAFVFSSLDSLHHAIPCKGPSLERDPKSMLIHVNPCCPMLQNYENDFTMKCSSWNSVITSSLIADKHITHVISDKHFWDMETVTSENWRQ